MKKSKEQFYQNYARERADMEKKMEELRKAEEEFQRQQVFVDMKNMLKTSKTRDEAIKKFTQYFGEELMEVCMPTILEHFPYTPLEKIL